MVKLVFIIALILVIHKNAQIYCQNDYDGLFDDPDYRVIEPESESTTVAQRTLTRSTSPRSTSKSTTTRKISKALSSSRLPEPEWEEPEVCELHEKCVPYYLCNGSGEINSDGTLLIDERFDGPMDVPIPACAPLEQCCKKVDYVIKEPEDGEDIVNICSGTGLFPTPSKCGFRNPKGLGGIVNSLQNRTLYSQYAEFPWMTAILVERPVGPNTVPVYQCGGSLIHPRVVLTTAHNIAGVDPNKLVVRAGEWDTQSEKELCKHEERKIQRIIRHEKFNRQNLQNDIALLVLNDGFEMTAFVNTICLPPKGSNFDNQRCLSSGWGKTKFGKSGIHQVFLKKVDLPIVENDDCQTKLRRTRLGEDFKLKTEFICAGGEDGKDLCTGDGGSPLVCSISSDPEHYYQAGIVVGGVGCGTKDVPGFYLDVAKYRDWIDGKLEGLGLDTAHYTY